MFGLFKKDENNQPKESLIEAVEKQNLFLVNKLAQSKKNLNELNAKGETALFVAVTLDCDKDALVKKYKIIEILLENKIEVFKKTKYGFASMPTLTTILENINYSEILEIFNRYGYFQDENFNENLNVPKPKIMIDTPKIDNKYSDFKEEAFIQAVKNSDKSQLEKLMNNSFEEINKLTYYGMTLLYFAVLFKKIDMVKFLLSKGANLKAKNNKLKYDYEIERASYYIKNIAFSIDAVSESRVLDEYKYYVDNHEGKNPLDLAIKNNLEDIVELFLEIEFHKDINKLIDGVSPLYKAVIDNDMELVKKLLNNGADIYLKNSDNYTELEKLNGGWIKHNLKTPLDGIIDSNNLTILKLITLEDKDISNLLDQAIIKRKIEIALYLIEKSKNLNEKAFLILECKDKIEPKFEIIKSLVEHNIDVNTLDEYNKSALFYLIESMYMDIDTIKFLIDNGADTNKGYPPLKLACQKQDYKLIKLLVNHGADVNAVDSYNGQSALFDAIEAKKANIDIIKFLLDNGADINQEDNKGITPLSFAQSNKKSLVKILTTVEEKKITKKQTPDRTMEYQELSKKITAQNRVINNLKKEIESLKENSNQKDFINELENQIEIQAKKIYTLENERLEKELETQKIITELLTKMETLEKNISKRSRVKKSSSIPTNIKIEHQSLKKDDGIIVRRDSFDDF